MLELNFTSFPVMETERLLIRRLREEDINTMFQIRSDQTAMKYVGKPLAKSIDDVTPLFDMINKNIAENEGVSWAVELKATGKMIGQFGFWRIDKQHHRGEIGYMFLPEHFGKGYASEAFKPIMDYGFYTLKFHSVEANIDPANLASQRILEKHGFVREACFRENFFFEGTFYDSAIYCILAKVWAELFPLSTVVAEP